MLEEYRKHVAERAVLSLKPLDANQMAALCRAVKPAPAKKICQIR